MHRAISTDLTLTKGFINALSIRAQRESLNLHVECTYHSCKATLTDRARVCCTYNSCTIRISGTYQSSTAKMAARTLVMHMNICSNIKCRAHTRGDHMVESYSCTMKNHNFRKCIYACFLCFRTRTFMHHTWALQLF